MSFPISILFGYRLNEMTTTFADVDDVCDDHHDDQIYFVSPFVKRPVANCHVLSRPTVPYQFALSLTFSSAEDLIQYGGAQLLAALLVVKGFLLVEFGRRLKWSLLEVQSVMEISGREIEAGTGLVAAMAVLHVSGAY